jgi:signal transduction histidine kinase/tetratricopeptide (TPR) repeat protein
MRKLIRLIFVGLLVLGNSLASAQIQSLIDSLKQKLPTSTGPSRFDILNALAWEYRFAYPDSTIYFAQQAYDFGKTLGVEIRLAVPLNYMGIAYNYNGNRIASLEYHHEAIEVASSHGDSSSIAHANNSIGRVYFEQGMVQQSIDYYFKAQKIFEEIKDETGIAYVYQSLGNLYRTQGDFVNTLDYYTKALAIRKKLGNKRNIMAALALMGRLHEDKNRPDSAILYLLQAEKIGQEIKDEIQVAEIHIFLAQNYLKKNELTRAEQYSVLAQQSISKVNNIRMFPLVQLTLGQIYLAQQKTQEAQVLFSKALKSAIEIKDAGSQRDAYYWLWKLAERNKQEDQAIRYQNQFLIMRDSTSNLELSREVDRLQFQLRMEKIDKENELLKSSEIRNEALIKQQRLQNLLLILGVVAGIAIVILQRVNNQRRKRINEQLALQNQQLSELNNEKDTLMNIMVHDLKAPLNNIKGLTSLVELDGGINTNQQYYLKLVKDSTEAGLEMITDLLDAHAMESDTVLNLEEIDIKDFITHRVNTFTNAAAEKQVTVEVNVADDVHALNTDKGYLARILDNLISNAIKFSPQGKRVWVTIARVNEGMTFSIKDEGQGFSEVDKQHVFKKFKKLSARPTAGESSNGLGLAIVKILIDRLGGTIQLNSKHGQGSEFIITLQSKMPA